MRTNGEKSGNVRKLTDFGGKIYDILFHITANRRQIYEKLEKNIEFIPWYEPCI